MSAHDLITTTTEWMHRWWDEDAALLVNPPGAYEDAGAEPRSVHMVRESAWYALGLFNAGEAEQARRVVAAVCATQYDEPGTVWHGTFPRFPQDPRPTDGARIWVDYDPNWRQFVGTTLALAAERFPGEVDERLVDATVSRAVAGEDPGRVGAWYSNIALMKAWLDAWWGRRSGDDELVASGEAFAAQVVRLFDRHGSFDEYNSPTYYGIDLYALALWREHPPTDAFAEWGARIEAALWRDVARWYHAGLRNLCGPYTRAYGMDMSAYVSDLSLWLWAGPGRRAAPLPDIDAPVVPHCHDLCFGTAIGLLGARIPVEVASAFERFEGERAVEQVLHRDPTRQATGWLGDDVMVGAESNPVGLGGWRQFHPLTAHWRTPAGLGWLRAFPPAAVDAVASPRRLDARLAVGAGDAIDVEVHAPGVVPDGQRWDAAVWRLPGATVDVSVTDLELAQVEQTGGVVALRYRAARAGDARFELRFR